MIVFARPYSVLRLCGALLFALLIGGCGNTCMSDADCGEDRPFCEAEQCAECRTNADCRQGSVSRRDGGITGITLGETCQEGSCEGCRCVSPGDEPPVTLTLGGLGLVLAARRRRRPRTNREPGADPG